MRKEELRKLVNEELEKQLAKAKDEETRYDKVYLRLRKGRKEKVL